MQKIRTTVRIAGKEYTIASYDSEEYVNRVADFVDRRMNELNLATRLPAQQLAVLTAVNATDDMMKSRDEITRLRAEKDALRTELEQAREEQDRMNTELEQAREDQRRLTAELDQAREEQDRLNAELERLRGAVGAMKAVSGK